MEYSDVGRTETDAFPPPHIISTFARPLADPYFFAKSARSELVRWSSGSLSDAGAVLFPMLYDARIDRYVAVEWTRCFNLMAEAIVSERETAIELPRLDILVPGTTGNYLAPRRWSHGKLVAHFVQRLARPQLSLGSVTLLLPYSDQVASGDQHIDCHISDGGGWILPLTVIEREVSKRLGNSTYTSQACGRTTHSRDQGAIHEISSQIFGLAPI